MKRERYTLHYLVKKFNKIFLDQFSHWEKMDFRTLKEAMTYYEIVDDNAYIIDNVTNKEIINNFRNK